MAGRDVPPSFTFATQARVKIEPRQAGAFLRGPLTFRAVLLHGDDEGLIRERAAMLTRRVAGSLHDPFQVTELDRPGWPSLAGEAAAISMMGGRRVIRARDVTDAVLEPLKLALKTPGDTLIILEAPELGRGKLRTFAESSKETASLACYPEEGAALQDSIRRVLAEHGVTADGEASSWLAHSLGSNRASLTAELDKLALLAGAGGKIDVHMARLCSGDVASVTADAGLLAATTGDLTACDRDLERALAEGLSGIALIRMALSHLQRLHQARLRMAGGMGADEAVRSLRPPVFFKLVGGMTASLALWPVEALARAIEEARQVEIACKKTGARQELLVTRFVSTLSRQSAARTGKRS